MMEAFQQLFGLIGIERQATMGDLAGFLSLFFLFTLVALNFTASFASQDEEKENEKKTDQAGPSVEVKSTKTQEAQPAVEIQNFSQRLFKGLSKSRSEVWSKVSDLFSKDALNSEEQEHLEEILYTSDLSVGIVDELMDDLKKNRKAGEDAKDKIFDFLYSKIEPVQNTISPELLKVEKSGETKVIMIVGVNGAGKTTTIGKLATKLKNEGASVVVGACDTFRAAAIEQLEVWCERAGVDLVKAKHGSDPSGVAYDALAKAQSQKADYCILDTAGRLHTATNLMEELKKTKRVLTKLNEKAPHQTLLVIDAITGQNALRQAEEFNKALELTGLIFTKCDGSAKAGSGVSMIDNLKVPIVYIGVGESVEDLDHFDTKQYLGALLGVNA